MDLLTCTCWLVATIASQHIDPNGLNQYNPGIGMEINGYAIGEYRNSIDRTSVYAGKLVETSGAVRAGFLAGAVSGYRGGAVSPLLAPFIAFEEGNIGVNMVVVPNPWTWRQSAVALQIKVRL